MKKVLIYSDCYIFGGCENVISNILSDEHINKNFNLIFYYAYSKVYFDGLKRHVSSLEHVKPIFVISSVNLLIYKLNLFKQKGINHVGYYFYLFLYKLLKLLELIGVFPFFNFIKFMRVFLKEKPDILLINNGGYPGAPTCRVAVLAAKLINIQRIIFIVNNIAVPPKSILGRLIDTLINKSVNLFVTASKSAGEHLALIRRFPISKIINIPNTLSTSFESKINSLQKGNLRSAFPNSSNKLIIGSVGLLTRRKGFHILIEAISLLNIEMLNKCHFYIFGDGEERLELEFMIRRYNLESFVFLPGFKSDIEKYILDFDLYINSSISHEDFPYSIIEAMALSKPVIGTRVAGIPEQITDGQTGWLVHPGDISDMANAIEIALENVQSLSKIGDAGKKKYMSQYSNSIVTSKYYHLLEAI